MLSFKNQERVVELKDHLIEAYNTFLQTLSVETPIVELYEEAIMLCFYLLEDVISVKHFNDHLKIINLGIDSQTLSMKIENKGIRVEE